jgi:methyl-accepting chemotaxis protein
MLKLVLIANDVTEAQTNLAHAQQRTDQILERQQMVFDALRVGLNKLSDGDLCVRLEDGFSEEHMQLRDDFNLALEKLSAAMETVIGNAVEIDGEANEITRAAEDLSQRTEKQAATLEQTAAALDELTSSVRSSADGVAEADRVVVLARRGAESSGEIVKQAVEAMTEIDDSSKEISKIIGVIDEIAFQTNLLALNAGVEAARAGEAGRGFAVVASEVRALAQRSSDAAREIDALITASTGHVRRGVDLVGEAGQALEGILNSVNDVAKRVSDIASGAKEQSIGLQEINLAMNQLDQVTQQNAAMFEQTTAASHSLSRGAATLRATVGQFRTRSASLDQMEPKATKITPAITASQHSASSTFVTGNAALESAPTDEEWENF